MDLETLKKEAAKRNLEVRNANKQELKRMLRADDVADKTLKADAEQQPVENRKANIPPRVTAEEREKHERNHLPFLNWCEPCVQGKARDKAHAKQAPLPEGDTKTVQADYLVLLRRATR